MEFVQETTKMPPKMYFPVLELFHTNMVLQLTKIKQGIEENNMDILKGGAHDMKSTSGYIGGARLHYAGYYIQKAYFDKDFLMMIEFYP